MRDNLKRLQDHTGFEFLANASACHYQNVDSILTRVVTLPPNLPWTVRIGQCPSFTKKQVTVTAYGVFTAFNMHSLQIMMMCHLFSQMDSANMKKDTAQYCAVAVSVALVFVAIVVAAFFWHKKEVAFRVAIAKHDERCVPP